MLIAFLCICGIGAVTGLQSNEERILKSIRIVISTNLFMSVADFQEMARARALMQHGVSIDRDWGFSMTIYPIPRTNNISYALFYGKGLGREFITVGFNSNGQIVKCYNGIAGEGP